MRSNVKLEAAKSTGHLAGDEIFCVHSAEDKMSVLPIRANSWQHKGKGAPTNMLFRTSQCDTPPGVTPAVMLDGQLRT